MDVMNSMLSVPVAALRISRFLLTTVIYVLTLGQKLAKSEVSFEPITGVDRFNVLSMKECSSADWNLKDTNIWGESAHYPYRMSQHCPVMISNSKQ